jgi:hypothetical protein
MTLSKTMAASLESTAKELAAAARLYQRMNSGQDSLAAGLGSLMEQLQGDWLNFLRARAREAAHAPQK